MTRIALCLFALAACRTAESARAESRATLVGTASFVGDSPTTDRGRVRMTVRGIAEAVDDTCRSSGPQRFVATYDGDLVVHGDGTFQSALYPNLILTGDGCIVTRLRVAQIDTIDLDGQLGDMVGHGALRFQNLAAVDGDELLAGAFDELDGDLTFARQ
jgi:hypothetical protein